MLDRIRIQRQRGKRRSPIILFLLILLWSVAVGWGLATVTAAQPALENAATDAIGTVDPVPQRYQLGEELYLENCATCHLAVPPAVLPTQTWQQLLQDTEHYGVNLPPLLDPQRLPVWNYLRTFSRPHAQEEQTPYRLNDSRYLKALHPKVKLPRPVELSSCISCHPNVADYNFRSLTPEWENSQ